MARKAPLKVFRTSAGFHDAYVAASSRKAALEAWGADNDLFAVGAAELVTDPKLTAEPLAHPGEVIRLSRGNLEQHVAALPASRPSKSAQQSSTSEKPSRKPAEVIPKPSSAALDRAERALAKLQTETDRRVEELRKQEAALAQERRDLLSKASLCADRLRADRDIERDRYDHAMAKWKAD